MDYKVVMSADAEADLDRYKIEGDQMKHISRERLEEILCSGQRKSLALREYDLSGMDLQGLDFRDMNLEGVNFEKCNLSGADFRGSNLRAANIKGVNLFGAYLERAILDDIISDEHTQYFRMRCPATGPLIGWKKCYDYRIVQLLIPADAKRTSATLNACRCDKAKVLTIKSIDYKTSYEEATSYVDDNFVYRRGEMAYASGFPQDRWKDSTEGIHFFMEREEAIAYL